MSISRILRRRKGRRIYFSRVRKIGKATIIISYTKTPWIFVHETNISRIILLATVITVPCPCPHTRQNIFYIRHFHCARPCGSSWRRELHTAVQLLPGKQMRQSLLLLRSHLEGGSVLCCCFGKLFLLSCPVCYCSMLWGRSLEL